MVKCDVSVVVPVYNVEKYLEKCIGSVRNQSKENIEIICVDDCSTDESLRILDKASSEDNRVHVIKNIENRGRLYARKCGVMAAEGGYIMFLDGMISILMKPVKMPTLQSQNTKQIFSSLA